MVLLFRSALPNHPTFNKDVVLLPDPAWDKVCKHKTKRKLHESGYILSAFEMRKAWDCKTEINKAFKDRIPEDFSILLMSCGNKLVSPKLHEGPELNGFMIHKLDSTDSEDSCVELDMTSASNDQGTNTQSQTSDYMITRSRRNQTASTQISSYPLTRSTTATPLLATQKATSDLQTRRNQTPLMHQATGDDLSRPSLCSITYIHCHWLGEAV
ncbi:uncharacterized protein LOC121632819 [Melanotaenia boesemani]|uniref:uncharacterized protein LOC121632819 n=1 Tax=Melanotaenia boesemani TaxID=1250792 RepID=UPI001C05EBD3|nr:uncharacterized protein LOC121632819 [Melanotaenia boesemani]